MKYPRIIFTVLLVSGLNDVAFAQPDVELAKTAIPEIQAQIRTTALAFLSGGNSESEVKTNWKRFRELAKLIELANNEQQLAKQLAIYTVIEQRQEEWQVMEALLVLQLLDLKPIIPIRALAPHLDSKNKNLREFSQIWFVNHDTCAKNPSALQALNYGDYVDYVRYQLKTDQQIPNGFIEYLYERSPWRALIVFSYANPTRHAETIALMREMRKRSDAIRKQRAQNSDESPALPTKNREAIIRQRVLEETRKGILLAEHIVSNAIWLEENGFDEEFQKALPEAREQLENMAEHDGWWVRLYVAEIMRRHRELRQVEVLEKLSHDTNTLVSKSAKSTAD